jgi:hypothetical protein
MIKSINEKTKNLEIDLTGPQGNAFSMIGTAKTLARKLGKDQDKIVKEMMSGDYDNLIKVFDREFGSFVTLYR